MADLESVLARVPGLAGYLAKGQYDQRQEAGQLQNQGSLLKIQEMMRQKQQEQDLNDALKASGGNLEQALPALIQAGHFKGEHLTAAMKLQSDIQSRKEARQAMIDLNNPQQSSGPQQLGIGQPISTVETESAAPSVQPKGNEAQLQRVKALMVQYAGNAAATTALQKELDRLQGSGTPSVHTVQDKTSPTGWSHADVKTGKILMAGAPPPASSVEPGNVETIAKAIAEYRQAPLTGFALRSPGAQAIMSRVNDINPQYDAKNFATAQQTMNNFSKGPQGNSVRSFNVALEHLDTLKDLTAALDNKDIKRINQVSQRVAEELGRPAPTNFEAAKQIIGEEIIKAVVTGGGGVTERQAAGERLSRANSPQQLLGVIDTYQNLLVGQLKGLKTQYEGGTSGRKDFEDRFLTPRARELYNSKSAPKPTGGSWTPEKEKRYQELKAIQSAP